MRARGGSAPAAAALAAKTEWLKQAHSVTTFMQTRTGQSPGAWITTIELLADYQRWAKEEGIPDQYITAKSLRRALKSLGYREIKRDALGFANFSVIPS